MRLFTVKYISYSNHGCETSTLRAKDKSESFFSFEEAKECLKYNFARVLEEDSEMIREFCGDNETATITYKDDSCAKFEIDSIVVPTFKSYADMFKIVESEGFVFPQAEIAHYLGNCLDKKISDDEFEHLCDYLYKAYLKDNSALPLENYVDVVNEYMNDDNKYSPADIYNGVSYREFLSKVPLYY